MKNAKKSQIIIFGLISLVCLIISIASFVIPGIYLSYIKKLHQNNCECSSNKLRDYITFYCVYAYVIILTLIILYPILGKKSYQSFIKSKILMLISIPLTYAFAVSLFLYQRKINKEICECAQQGYVPVLMKVNSIAIIIVSTLSLLLLVITSSKMINKK